MSRDELVGAFLDGRISRRTLIRRLVATGVSTGAAVSYARMLGPERAEAKGGDNDHYPLVDLKIVSKSLGTIRQKSKIAIKVTSSEEIQYLFLSVMLKTSGGGVQIGHNQYSNFIGQAGSTQISLPIFKPALAGLKSARIYVLATGNDAESQGLIASTAKTFK